MRNITLCKVNLFPVGKRTVRMNFDFRKIPRKNICDTAFLDL